MAPPKLKVLAFNCSLKSAHAREKSSTDTLLKQLMDEFEEHGAKGEVIRAVHFEIKPGVSSDEGANDAWPQLRQRVINSDIVIIATPIWLGQPLSVAKRVLTPKVIAEWNSLLASNAVHLARLLKQKNFPGV